MNKRKVNALLIIDAQNDFCNPDGSLFVPGADKDMERLSNWIIKNKEAIDFIGLTLDSHQVNDIAHPSFWADKNGNFPDSFTQISYQDIESGKWTPRFWGKTAKQYIKNLEEQDEFPHTIWPEHCLIGSKGAALCDQVSDAITEWSRLGNWYQTIAKGTYPTTEHFGAFMAQIPVSDRPETQLNQDLVKTLEEYQNVYFVGEAKSHCVANTLKQALNHAENLAQKFVILEDCMSNVPGFENIADDIYKEARKRNIRFSTTDQENLVSTSTAPSMATV